MLNWALSNQSLGWVWVHLVWRMDDVVICALFKLLEHDICVVWGFFGGCSYAT